MFSPEEIILFRLDHNLNNSFEAEWDDIMSKGMMLMDLMDDLLKRVAQFILDQQIITADHDCSATCEISICKRRKN